MKRSRALRYGRSAWPILQPEPEGPARWKVVLAVAATIALGLGAAGWQIASDRMVRDGERDAQTLCLRHHPPARSVLVLLDETDTLARDSGERFKRLIRRIRDDLPRNGRLTIVPFGGDLGVPLIAAFDVCSPGRRAEANDFSEGPSRVERDYRAKFEAPLDRIADALAGDRTSPSSPIAMQIERAINDPAIHWSGEHREIFLISDGLENSSLSLVYSGRPVRLPPPPPDLLAGVTVTYVELANARHSALQTRQMREAWRAWFTAAGASRVEMRAPGYPPPAEAGS